MVNQKPMYITTFFVFSVLLLLDMPIIIATNDSIYITTEHDSYRSGDLINVNGRIDSYTNDDFTPIILRIIDSDNNIVMIDQFTPKLDGVFQKSYPSSGPLWKSSGEYFITINYDTYRTETSFLLKNVVNNYKVESTLETYQQQTVDEKSPQIIVEKQTVDEKSPQIIVEKQTVDEKSPQIIDESIVCGPSTIEKDGMCIPEVDKEPIGGGGCLIATATYDSELSDQIKSLRHIRDNVILNTRSGQTFMQFFNGFYYSFSPYIADLEREHVILKETIKIMIAPLLFSLSLFDKLEINSDYEMIFYGLLIIMLNILIYLITPTLSLLKIKRILKK